MFYCLMAEPFCRQAGIVAVGLDLPARRAMGEDVADLAHRDDGTARLRQRVEDGVGRRRHGEILAVAGALEAGLGRADEGPRDDAADLVGVAELASDAAQLVEALEPERLLMCRDLQHAVDRGVEDRLAGAHMLRAVFVDDGGAVTVDEGAAAGEFGDGSGVDGESG